MGLFFPEPGGDHKMHARDVGKLLKQIPSLNTREQEYLKGKLDTLRHGDHIYQRDIIKAAHQLSHNHEDGIERHEIEAMKEKLIGHMDEHYGTHDSSSDHLDKAA